MPFSHSVLGAASASGTLRLTKRRAPSKSLRPIFPKCKPIADDSKPFSEDSNPFAEDSLSLIVGRLA